MYKKFLKRIVSVITIAAVIASMFGLSIVATAETTASITYSFSGTNASDAGYAEGVITVTSSKSGTYKLYWADDQNALDGYYSIASLNFDSSSSKSVKMGYHTAIPANATKIIATTSSKTVAEADAVYSIPTNKQLNSGSGELMYTFNSYSDVHIDSNGYYTKANERLADAFAYGVEKNTNFIVTSGDMVTNANGPDSEWNTYETILSESGYVNPVWESDGNHDMRCGISSGLKSFIRATGTDSTKENYDRNQPYYYMIEENTGDVFIFMALENGSSAGQNDEFTDEQLTWVTNLIEQYYNTDVNIYIVEHAPINGFGAGDNMQDPYYGGLLKEDYPSTVKFKNILMKYKNLVFLSGHTHEDFEMNYNYSNENDTACHMIHNPSVAGTTMPKTDEHKLEYKNGVGFHSQGYYVEAYQNRIVFYGANLTDKLIYPQYSYVMEGSRTIADVNPSADQNKISGAEVSVTDKLSEASGILADYYSYASYDQYQALKKLYYQYKNDTTADESVIAKFDEKIAALTAIAEHTGMPKLYTIGKKYHFENTKSWSKVYAYAWTGKTHNEEWPGKQINVTGSSNGKEVYTIEFDTAGQYRNLIFTNGTDQTVDIPLAQYKYDAFRLAGKDSNGKYYVENFDIESGSVSTSNTYALLYYVESEHNWDDTSKVFTKKDDGTYQYSYTASKNCNISMSVYDKTNGVYKSLTESRGFDYDEGLTYDFTLTSLSSRGKSITVRNLEKGNTIYINYTPSTEKITVSCGVPKAEPNGSITLCDGTITNNNIPYRSISNNDTTGTQQAYPASMLTALTNKEFWSMSLYSPDETEIDVKGMQVYLAQVEFSALPDGWVTIPSNAVKVYDGDYSFAGGKNTIEFSKPFEYKGGNLLVVIQNTTPGSNNDDKEFYGVTTANDAASCYRYSSSNNTASSSFLSKCTFAFVDDNLYTVTWKNYDGTLLETDAELPYGTIPSYDGEIPSRPADAQYTYTFSGWTPEITPVNGDITYTAEYSTTVNTYTVTWVNADESVLEIDENVPYGTMPKYDGETPTFGEKYSFLCWTPEVTAVTGDATYKAVYEYNNIPDTDTATDSSNDSGTDTATDSSTDSGTDTATDSSTDSGTDTTTDSSTDSGTDTTTDSSTDSGTDTTTDSSTDSGTDTTTDSSTDSDIDTTTDSSTDSDIDTTTDSSTDSGTDTTTDSSTDSGTDTTTDSESVSDTDTTTDSTADTSTDSTTDSESVSDTDTTTDSTVDTSTDSTTDSESVSDTDTTTDSTVDTSTDATTDSESVSDTDTATDSETDGDTESDTDTDTDIPTDTDVDTDTMTDSETDVETDTEIDTDTETDIQTDTDTLTDIETETDTATDTENDTDTHSDTETDTTPDSDTETQSDTDTVESPDVPTDTDTESDSDTETDTELDSDTGNEPELYGDINGDKKVTAKDSLMAQRCAIKLAILTDKQLKAADVDKDGKVTAKDALYILRCSINLAVLPIEK